MADGADKLLGYLVNGGGSEKLWTAFVDGMQGDFVLSVSPATLTPAPTSAAWSQDITIKLVTSNGDLHEWYSGPIKLGIADTSTLGTASIDPAGTTPNMVNGEYTVAIKGDAKAWANGETVTLTVSDPDTTGFGGWTAEDATCVMTFTT